MAKCGKGCMPECEYFTTGGCISPFNCQYKIETGYINSTTSTTYSLNEERRMTDIVNHPSHYTDGKIEVIEFIEDKNLNYHRGNAIKYICRAGKKDPSKEVEDLQKAIWYINREIKNLKRRTK